MRATRAIIHLDYFKENIANIASMLSKGTRICIPVKADAYGHGAIQCSIAAIQAGARFLAVASVQEGIELRIAGIVAPILLFSLPLPQEIPEIIEHRLTPLVADSLFARLLAKESAAQGTRTAVHLKIDSGMGRIGCRPENALDLAREIVSTQSLYIEGTATHLSSADSIEESDYNYTKEQLRRFTQALKTMRESGIDPGICHAANSGAIVLHPDSFFDMVRPGLLAYGYEPIRGHNKNPQVRAVMELDTHISCIKQVKKGESISYGRKWTAVADTRIATLPIGYADGLPRALSGQLQVSIGGKPFPQVGRICMDQCMVDIGPGGDPALDIPKEGGPKRWDRAVIFGPQPPSWTARDLADRIDTIPYEICCGIHKRVPRIYSNSPKQPIDA